MATSDLVVVSRFRSTADAQVAQGILDEADIESMIRSDDAGGMYPALAGAELLVRVKTWTTPATCFNRRPRRKGDAPLDGYGSLPTKARTSRSTSASWERKMWCAARGMSTSRTGAPAFRKLAFHRAK